MKKRKKKIKRKIITKSSKRKITKRRNPTERFTPEEIEEIRITASPIYESAQHFVNAIDEKTGKIDYNIFAISLISADNEGQIPPFWATGEIARKIVILHRYLDAHPNLLSPEIANRLARVYVI